MTVWARATRGRGDYEDILQTMRGLQIEMGSPHDLMMLKAPTGKSSESIFLALPNPTLLQQFATFSVIERSEIPDTVTPLLMRRDSVERMFPDIARRIGFPV